ncbi:RNA polymerase sigma factor (sigma-70 family) [Chitinophaga niastensis]|uniref:RNA polymerase sigma factor (Sigma-70 family) n=1 Tax=Chitinophaga niastensis TaxID=536980 RepID=A0A2P8HNL2_CHINA|nr:sigma-70 family RNA polymerase sigma factor [Chitinophaga niastensis]PSL47802.1 RNA polymerase sigma factor (sigma-70 family) [Chitinophaga niastensis]
MLAMKDEIFNEDALWKRFKAGDKAAFSLIYREYTVHLFQYGFRFCDDREKLKDMVHDLFIELWNSRDTVSDQVAIRFYLCRSLKYKLIRSNYQYRTATDRRNKYLHDNYQDQVESTVEERMIDTEINDSRSVLLDKAIKKLSRRQQEIITLRFYMGFTNAQIAELMHMKYQSVSNLLYSALGRIKETLQISPFAVRLLETFHLFL